MEYVPPKEWNLNCLVEALIQFFEKILKMKLQFEFLQTFDVYFGLCFDFLIFFAKDLKVKLLGGKVLRFSKMNFEIWGANISKNNIRGNVALAFLGLIFIDLLRNIDFTKNVDCNILDFFEKNMSIFFRSFAQMNVLFRACLYL